MQPIKNKKYYIEGAQIDTATFDPNAAYTYCNLCGAIFQSLVIPEPQNTATRRSWAISHSNSHSPTEHKLYKLAGNFLTPEAQIRLAGFGIVELTNDPNTRQALKESKPLLDNIEQPSRKELRSVL